MDIIQRAREQIKRRYIEATDHEQNAYEIMLKLIGQNEDQAAEIERLTAELELTKKVLEQADLPDVFEVSGDSVFLKANDGYWGNNKQVPELYAHIGGGK